MITVRAALKDPKVLKPSGANVEARRQQALNSQLAARDFRFGIGDYGISGFWGTSTLLFLLSAGLLEGIETSQ